MPSIRQRAQNATKKQMQQVSWLTHVPRLPPYFLSTREGKASIVTGHIDTFTETGIEMKSGEKVEADFIISATGLALQKNFPFSTMKVTIDGEEYKAPDHLIYNSIMIR